MLEAYTTLGALAARTRRIRLGTLVTGVTYRNPAMLVKHGTRTSTVATASDAGFRGFTFGNPNLNTPEKLVIAGELKRMLS